MAHSSTISPALTGHRASSRPARKHSSKRRRLVILFVLVLIVGLSVAVNYGPMTAYRNARARLDTATVQVNELQKQKEQLQSELGKLGEAGYLESLARGQLTYAEPGEEVYIIPPADDAASTQTTEAAKQEAGEKPGLLERILSALGDIF
jgi:cell division protein FtsB